MKTQRTIHLTVSLAALTTLFLPGQTFSAEPALFPPMSLLLAGDRDCNGVKDGTAYMDNCDTCVSGNTGETACIQDCNEDWGGTAYADTCGTCVGGSTGQNACRDGSSASLAGDSCKGILLLINQSTTGLYWVDGDGEGGYAPQQVWCDMSTDGGGWTLVFNVFELNGFAEDNFIASFGDNLWTDHGWRFDTTSDTISDTSTEPVEPGVSQGMLDMGILANNWDDLRFECSDSDNASTMTNFAQVAGYATANGNHSLLGATANGTSYTIPASHSSFDQTMIWHDNEPNTGNSDHYLCDTYNDGEPAAQFGFCYTDFLNNPNTLDYGDSIVSLSFGYDYGSDDWSTGFAGECGDMERNFLSNSGTFRLWVR